MYTVKDQKEREGAGAAKIFFVENTCQQWVGITKTCVWEKHTVVQLI